MDQNSYRPWNILLHKKKHATSVWETFHVNRLPFRVYSLAFRAKRVSTVWDVSSDYIWNCQNQLFFFSKWRPSFTFLQMICNWQYTYVCIVMKINLENDRPIFLSSLYSVSTKDRVFNGVCFEALSCRCNIKMHNTSKCFFTVYKMWLPKKKSKSTLGRSSLMLKIITVSGVSYWNFIIFVMLQHK